MSLIEDVKQVFFYEDYERNVLGEQVNFEISFSGKIEECGEVYASVRIVSSIDGYTYGVSACIDPMFVETLHVPIIWYLRTIRDYHLDCFKKYLLSIKEEEADD